MASPKSPVHIVVLACLVAFLSYLAAELGGALVLRPQMVWPLWPGCAFLVAVLLLLPRGIWPILIAAGLAGFVLYDLHAGLTFRSTGLLILADTVEILIASLGASYLCAGLPRLNSVASLARYSFVAVILAPMAAAFISTSAFGGSYWIRWRIGFLTEALALLTLTPAILAWARTRQAWVRKPRAFYFEAATLVAGLTLLSYVAFVAPVRSSAPVLLYSLLPFLLWSALRFGMTGISTSMIVVAFLSIWGAVHARGPFNGAEPLNNVMSLQLFLFFAVAPFMVLAVLVEERERTGHALRESEERFRLMADTAPALIWMSGTDKRCTYFNKPWLDFTGRSMDSELGNGWVEGVHADDLRTCLDTYTQAFDRREEFRMEYRLRRHDAEYRWVLDIGVPRFDQETSFAGYIGIAVDVTESKQAEEALFESDQRFRLAAQAGNMYSFDWDVSADTVVRSPERAKVLGITEPLRVTHRQFVDTIHQDDRPRFLATIAALTTEKPSAEIIYRVIVSNGAFIWLRSSARAFFDSEGRMLRVVGMVADVTSLKRAEEALSGMSRKLIESQEQERDRIGRELHDDIGQRLSLLAFQLTQLHNDTLILPEVRGRMGECLKQTSEIATDIQSLSHELHSSNLKYLGVAAAIRNFCRELGEQQKVEIDFKAHDLPSPLPQDISLCLFRVLQEALHNSVKHSGVKHFEVRLWATSDEVQLTVRDSGMGFDREAAKERRGLGLISMEERLKLVKGALSIESQLKRGTTIHARVPIVSGSDSMSATAI